jgi:mevalonate kinase
MGIDVKAEPGIDKITIHTEMDGEAFEGRWTMDQPTLEQGPLRFVPAAIHALTAAGVQLVPTDLWVQSNLPAGRGFSSSAAFCLGIIDAMARTAGCTFEARDLVDLAYSAEHDHLGVSCGRLDPAACAAGQPLFLRWTPQKNGLLGMHARRISPISVFHFVVGAFNQPRNTKGILDTLNQHHEAPMNNPNGDAVREAIAEFAVSAEAGARAMETGDIQSLGQAMDHVQNIYETNLADRFRVAEAPQLFQTCRQLRKDGALGAKFSGAGGDGSVVALFATENEARSAAILMEEKGIQAWYAPASTT